MGVAQLLAADDCWSCLRVPGIFVDDSCIFVVYLSEDMKKKYYQLMKNDTKGVISTSAAPSDETSSSEQAKEDTGSGTSPTTTISQGTQM